MSGSQREKGRSAGWWKRGKEEWSERQDFLVSAFDVCLSVSMRWRWLCGQCLERRAVAAADIGADTADDTACVDAQVRWKRKERCMRQMKATMQTVTGVSVPMNVPFVPFVFFEWSVLSLQFLLIE